MEQRFHYEKLDHLDQDIFEMIRGQRISDVYAIESITLEEYDFPRGWKIDVAVIGSMGSICVNITKANGDKLNYNRNYYGLGPCCYAKQNNQEFLICSTDYQCITIINLTTGDRHTYGDKKAIAGGHGFCPVEARWDEDTNHLYIVGCIWAWPYEQMVCEILDLNNPEEGLSNATYYDEDGEVSE